MGYHPLLYMALLCMVCSLEVKSSSLDKETNIRLWDTSKPSTSVTNKLVCYFPLPYTNYSTTLPKGLNATLCTHVIFIPSTIVSCELAAADSFHLDVFAKAIPIIKKQNPNLKVMLSNGGYHHHTFVPVLQSDVNMARFANSTIPFLRKYGFDGFDLDWEFPGWPILPFGQRHNFSLVTIKLRKLYEMEAIQTKRPRLLLSAALGKGRLLGDIYEYNILSETLDFANLMGYDFHSFSIIDPFLGFNCPLYPESYDKKFGTTNNLAWDAEFCVSKGFPREKLIVGLPTYVHTYTLWIKYFTKPGTLARGLGNCDQCGYEYACQMLRKNWTREYDDGAKVPYLTHDDQWVSYDDVASITTKAQWIKNQSFGGIMAFSLTSDDTEGYCDGVTKFPLILAMRRTLFGF